MRAQSDKREGAKFCGECAASPSARLHAGEVAKELVP